MNTYGQRIAAIILVGSRLGHPISFTKEAMQMLKGGEIRPQLLGYLDKEAQHIVEWVNASNLTNKANTMASKLLQQNKH